MLRETGLPRALVVYLRETDMPFLATRRRRSAEAYQALLDGVQTGSERFEYVVYRSDASERLDLRTRAHRVLELLRPALAGHQPARPAVGDQAP